MTRPLLKGLTLLAAALAALAATACPSPRSERPGARSRSADPPAAPAGYSSEAERTRRMEEQARGMNDRWSEVQTMEGTDAEKEQAVQRLLEEQQALNREGQGEPAPPPE